jgi:hypothetical protein
MIFCINSEWSLNSSVDIAVGYVFDGRDSVLDKGKLFYLLQSVQTSSGAHPASCRMVPWVLSPGERQPGQEADHSDSSSAEVKVELYLHAPIVLN